MSEQSSEPQSGWRRFWNRGGVLKALLIVVAYLALYRLAGFVSLLVVLVLPTDTTKSPLGSPTALFSTLTLPLILGAALLLVFVASVRWFPTIFGPQPIRGRWWMWIFVAVAIVPIVLRLFGIDYGAYGAGIVALTLFSGLFIGLSEELLYRGIVVTLLRRKGYREWVVAIVSAALFALSHSVNILSGQLLTAVALTVAYTFGFGILMYLALRVTGHIVWPMLIHALTDPTTMLAVGGIDSGSAASDNPLLSAAVPFNLVILAAGLIALIFIRGRVGPSGRVEQNGKLPHLDSNQEPIG